MTKSLVNVREGRHLRRERRRWDDAELFDLPLGCKPCADYEICGGIHKQQLDFDCLGDCCREPSACDNVCPRNIDTFIDRYREVDGFGLDNIPRATPCLPPELPSYIPMIFHGNRRRELLDYPIVALPLHKFYSRRDGSVQFRNRVEIETEFKVRRSSRIVLVGSGRDKSVEAWWGLSHKRREILRALVDLGIEAITAPNYSLFTDVPRHDNLYNLKRIGITWYESVDCGLSCALHLNARTQQDYSQLADFVRGRAEAMDVVFEFKTGGAWRKRRDFHHRQLAEISRRAGKPIRMFMIGGIPAISKLAPAYNILTFIDTSPFMKALHRQRLASNERGAVIGELHPTERCAPVDNLLANNIAVMRDHVDRLISASRVSALTDDIVQRQESRQTDSSARALRILSQDAIH